MSTTSAATARHGNPITHPAPTTKAASFLIVSLSGSLSYLKPACSFLFAFIQQRIERGHSLLPIFVEGYEPFLDFR